ncbi:MAG: hypothetical protein J6S23_01060 [Clostridia bacterium]|nr:hypothetical protein [Clostridia bacterium]
MRLFHYALLPYLPELQFRGQLRELVVIMRDWRDKGKTNHLLINRVMEYPREELSGYFLWYQAEWDKRYHTKRGLIKYDAEFAYFADNPYWFEKLIAPSLFDGWHDKTYLRICMSNLLEKHLNPGKTNINDKEWARLLEGYKAITGEDYEI